MRRMAISGMLFVFLFGLVSTGAEDEHGEDNENKECDCRDDDDVD